MSYSNALYISKRFKLHEKVKRGGTLSEAVRKRKQKKTRQCHCASCVWGTYVGIHHGREAVLCFWKNCVKTHKD